MAGSHVSRRTEDIGGQELSYAEVKAIASGNPAVLTLAETDAELQRLNLLKKQHLDEQFIARRSLRQLPDTINSLSQRLSDLTADRETAEAHADDAIIIGDQSVDHDVINVLGKRLNSIPDHARDTKRVPIGAYRGLRFGLVLHPQFTPEIYLQGTTVRQSMLSRENQGPRAVLNALERMIGGYGTECERVRQDLEIAQGQKRDYQARLGQEFAHTEYLTKLTQWRDLLKAGLSGGEPKEGAPSVGEIAEKIKELRAEHTVEPTPERMATRRVSPEEPVTARIRRRGETMVASDPATGSSDAALPAPTPFQDTGTTQDWSSRPEVKFQEGIARGR